jgi:hypothetical protein
MTGAPADRPAYQYRIRVRGRLGETIRSAFPALQAQASGGDTVLTGRCPTAPRCMACSRRSRRSGSNCSKSAACHRTDPPPQTRMYDHALDTGSPGATWSRQASWRWR